MSHGQAGTLSEQCAASGSGGQGEGGGTHRHRKHTRGHCSAQTSAPSRNVGPCYQIPCPFQKKPRIPNFYVTFLSYCNLVWPHKIFLGPDIALDWQYHLYCRVKLIYHGDGKLEPATQGQLIPHDLPEGLNQPQRHKLQ